MTPEGADVMTDAAQGQKGSATSSRPKWSPWFDGKLAVAASIFGPYDLLVFPMLFYWGGGGAFLLIYLLFVALMAVPLLFLEVGIGQFMDRGAMAVWNIAPLFKGIGYVTTAVSAHVFWIALWMLTVQGLFWVDLGQSYVPSPDLCGTSEGYGTNDSYTPCQYAAVGLYSDRWPDHSLESGTVEGSKVLAMLLMLLLVCGVSAAGVRVVGKVTAVCLIVPCFLTLLMMVRVVTLPGAAQGLLYAFFPDWSQLAPGRTWVLGCSAAIYNFGTTRGILITVGSYNRFNNNFLLDCLAAVGLKIVMSICMSVTVLGAFGVAALFSNRDISELVLGNGASTLALLTDILLVVPPSGGFWAACVLISAFLLSLNEALWIVESVTAAVRDLLPSTPRFRVLRRKPVLLGVFAVPWFICGLSFCTVGAMQSVGQLSSFCGSYGLMALLSLLQCVAVGWMYGGMRFQANWAAMQGCCCCPYPLIFWAVVTPLLLFVMLIAWFFTLSTYNHDLIQLAAFIITLLVVVISAVIIFCKQPGSVRQKWRAVSSPQGLADHQLRPRDRRYNNVAMGNVRAV